jgi:hypothetical protein
MNRFGRCLRNLLLFALVGWAGVDDYFPSVGNFADPGAENGEYLLFDGAGSRRAGAAEELSPSAFRSLSMVRPLGLAGDCIAAVSPPLLTAHWAAGQLYALMSLRR